MFAGDARAWIFHEHFRITEAAIQGLPAQDRAMLDALWAKVRTPSDAALCADPVRVETTKDDMPACISFTMLPAIAADHSCSPEELSRTLQEPWMLRVVRIGATTEKDLAAAKNERQRIDAWNAMHLLLERADREYTARAISNDGHFLLPRTDGDLAEYLADAVDEHQLVNAASNYAVFHLAAIAAARAYARAPAGSREARVLARAILHAEAFALHFLEDSFSAGHFVGAWGDKATKKGTHDLYSSHGIDAFTWVKEPYSAHGDAFLAGVDRTRTSDAVRKSLAAVLAEARGNGAPRAGDPGNASAELGELRFATYDACVVRAVDVRLDEASVQALVAPVWSLTPMPSSPEERTPPIRKRAEIGPFFAFQSGGSGYAMFNGFQSPEPAAPRAAFSLEAAIGVGYGLEGITTSGGDGKFFLTAGVTAQSAQFDDFCSGDCVDERAPGSLVPRVPPRVGYGFRVRMPFWLIPGDLLIVAPVMAFVARRELTKMGIVAADGGLIPWQRVLPTAIGEFQFMAGREAAFTFFDLNDSVRYLGFAGTDASGAPVYNPTRVRSLQMEFPLVEYRPFRSFSEKIGASLAAQFGVGLEIPFQVDPQRADLPAPDLSDVFSLYLRIFFDGRAYF